MVVSEISSEARDHFGCQGFQANLKKFVGKGIPHLQKNAGSGLQKKLLRVLVVKKEEKQWLQ
jgi:hypothetical protein